MDPTTPQRDEHATFLESIDVDGLERILAGFVQLTGRFDRDLRVTEERVDAGRMRAPVPDRLHESVLVAGAVVPTPAAPHIVSGRVGVRVTEVVDRVTAVTFDTAPNRVAARVLDLAAHRISAWLGDLGDDDEGRRRLSGLRDRVSSLRRAAALSAVSHVRSSDYLHRSLRMAPKYRQVLELHRWLVAHRDVGGGR